MALWTMILRKMANNKWLQLNLWFGLAVCVALFSSMPLYSQAILQRTLFKELQLLQTGSSVYPGYLRIGSSVAGAEMSASITRRIQNADKFVQGIPGRLGIEAVSFYQTRSTQNLKVYGADASEEERKHLTNYGSFRTVTELDKRVRLVDGRMPNPDRGDGVIEAVVTQSFLLALKRDLGDELVGEREKDGTKFRVMPVGVIDNKPDADPYLPYSIPDRGSGFYIPFEQFDREFTVGGRLKVSTLDWRYALDYTQLKVRDIPGFTGQTNAIKNYFSQRLGISDVDIPALRTIDKYNEKQEKLSVMLLSLYAPVMLMLVFYLYMAANLIIDRQKNDISVLRSRGASRLQIMLAYTVEYSMLGLTALAAGPFIGVLFTKVLGSANGFLSFVQRSALEVSLNSDAYRIAALAVGGSILLILIPAFLATRVSIVGHKQQQARMTRMSFWHKTGIDIILVAFSLYLLHGFRTRMEDMKALALEAGSLDVDPLLFLMPALFALGGGLLVLRVYPWFIRLVYWLGRRWWPPALYHTLIQISRSSGQYLTIKVFLIMTVATGLFSANSARTINDNMENKIRYMNGADIALKTVWENDAPPPPAPGGPPAPQADQSLTGTKRIQYTEPPFLPYTELKGVEHAAAVFRKEQAAFSVGQSGSGAATLYGVNTYDFGMTAWPAPGLNKHQMNSYLNLIAADPKAVLISRSMADTMGVKPGDPIWLSWEGLDQSLFTVYGVVDYWPGWNPLPQKGSEAKPHLVVGHLATIQNQLALEPYEVWLKLKPGTKSQTVYDELEARKLPIMNIKDTAQDIVKSKNDPFRLAINGVMTLGFVISMVISFCGFLLFWVLTLSGRTLQYGVLRAMGIPFRQIVGMLVSEQLLTSGAAVLIGVMAGNVVSRLFVPMFEMAFNPSEQVPPFRIVYNLGDYLNLYSIVGIMLAAGLLILAYRLSRIRIAQALKLGEE